MSLEDYIGPAYSVGDKPDDRAAMRTLLIRLARKAAFHDSAKLLGAQPKVGDLVVEFSSFKKIPDPNSTARLMTPASRWHRTRTVWCLSVARSFMGGGRRCLSRP